MKGFDCFIDGFSLIRRPGLRRFFIVPTLINIFVLAALVGGSASYFDDWLTMIMGWFPDWMSALYWLVWFIAFIVVLVMVLFCFSFIANIIASPFNAILSIKVEEVLTGKPPVSTVSPWIPRLVALLLVTLVPVVNTVSPFLWVLFGAWMMAIQYADYGADNNDVSFSELRRLLERKRFAAIMFGLPAYLLLTVPFVNLILMPVGVAGGTRFWVEHLKD
jgi:CysZ protein